MIAAGAAGKAFTVTVSVAAFEQPPLVTVYDITEVPAVTPVTKPPALIVATAGVALDHTPLAVTSANCVVNPIHAVDVPVIAATVGSAFTVTVRVAVFEQPPLVIVYEITEVPAVTPVTKPPTLIVATAGVALDQTPLAVTSANCVVNPTHTVDVPVITAGAAGKAFMVTVSVAAFEQPPLVTVYETTEVPAVTPVTKPPALIVATAGVALDQTPLAVTSANCVVNPMHAVDVPVIAATVGSAVIVTV